MTVSRWDIYMEHGLERGECLAKISNFNNTFQQQRRSTYKWELHFGLLIHCTTDTNKVLSYQCLNCSDYITSPKHILIVRYDCIPKGQRLPPRPILLLHGSESAYLTKTINMEHGWNHTWHSARVIDLVPLQSAKHCGPYDARMSFSRCTSMASFGVCCISNGPCHISSDARGLLPTRD
jgi:hypothetical protein